MIQISQLHYTLALGCLLTFASCSTADSPNENFTTEGNYIKFHTNLSAAAETRGTAFEQDEFNSFNVTAIFGKTLGETEALALFNDVEFTKAEDNNYHSATKYVWPNTNLDFFAYYPADSYTVTTDDNTLYKLKNFNVAKDIASHVDFVASYAHSAYDNSDTSVALQFFHQLSQIVIDGVYNPDETVPYEYTVEVAGVRIGHVPMNGDFNFNKTNTPYSSAFNDGSWDLGENPYGVVEYKYQAGDNIVKLGKGEAAKSLMGNGGNAMVIPANITKWDAKGNPSNTNEGGLTEGMYLSVLIRVTEVVEGKTVQLYPTKGLNDDDQTEIVGIPVDESGNKVVASRDNIKQFGWAAVPVSANLNAGKRYKYTLNYSKGVGLRDPKDPKHPGDPILGGELQVTIGLEPWADDEGFNGNIDIKDEISNKDNNQGESTE